MAKTEKRLDDLEARVTPRGRRPKKILVQYEGEDFYREGDRHFTPGEVEELKANWDLIIIKLIYDEPDTQALE